MISGVLLALLLPLTALSSATDEAAAQRLLDSLQLGGGKALAFTEVRESPLLTEAVEMRGTLRRGDDDRLIRETETPRQQTHTLSERHVEIRREQRRQRFSIQRAPELAALRLALLAVLDADAESLAEHFSMRISSDGQRWTLDLVPLDVDLAERVAQLSLSGEEGGIDLMVMQLGDGETVRTELSPAL